MFSHYYHAGATPLSSPPGSLPPLEHVGSMEPPLPPPLVFDPSQGWVATRRLHSTSAPPALLQLATERPALLFNSWSSMHPSLPMPTPTPPLDEEFMDDSHGDQHIPVVEAGDRSSSSLGDIVVNIAPLSRTSSFHSQRLSPFRPPALRSPAEVLMERRLDARPQLFTAAQQENREPNIPLPRQRSPSSSQPPAKRQRRRVARVRERPSLTESLSPLHEEDRPQRLGPQPAVDLAAEPLSPAFIPDVVPSSLQEDDMEDPPEQKQSSEETTAPLSALRPPRRILAVQRAVSQLVRLAQPVYPSCSLTVEDACACLAILMVSTALYCHHLSSAVDTHSPPLLFCLCSCGRAEEVQDPTELHRVCCGAHPRTAASRAPVPAQHLDCSALWGWRWT